MMVSLIQSNFNGMGSGLMPDGLGFMFQNRGEAFTLQDGHPNVYAPGKRPFHTIIPGFATRGGEPWLAFGVMGGNMQPQGQTQIITDLVDYGLGLQEAGDAPRWLHEGSREPNGEARRRDAACCTWRAACRQAAREGLAALGWDLAHQAPAATAATRRSSGCRGAMRRPAKCARMGRRWRTEREAAMTLDEMREIVLSFPGVTEGTSYGQPAVHWCSKKFFTRLRREDDSLVLLEVSFDEREMLIEAEPADLPLHRPLQGLSRRAGADGEPAPRLVPQLPRPPLAPDRPEEAGQGTRRRALLPRRGRGTAVGGGGGTPPPRCRGHCARSC